MEKVTRMLIPIVIIVVAIAIATPLFIIPAVSPRPTNLGVQDGRFTACPPNTMNCVSSQQDTRASRAMSPLPYTGSAADAKARLLNFIQSDGATIVDAGQPNYIYAEYRTPLMRFIDDVEFYIDDTNNVIHFRSASRIGTGDGGTNKARMKDFARRFLEQS